MIFKDPCSVVKNIQEQIESILPHISNKDLEKRLFCFLVGVECSNQAGKWKKPCAILVKINIERMEIKFYTSLYEFNDVLQIREQNYFNVFGGIYNDLVPFIQKVVADVKAMIGEEPSSTEIFVSAKRTFAVEKIEEQDTLAIISWDNEFKDLIQHHHYNDQETRTVFSFVDIDSAVERIYKELHKLKKCSFGIVLSVSVHVCLTSDEEDEESCGVLLLCHRPYNFFRVFQSIGDFFDIDHPEKSLFWKVLTKEHDETVDGIFFKRIQKCVGGLKKLLVGEHTCTKIDLSFRIIPVCNVINAYGIDDSLIPDMSFGKTEDELYEMCLKMCNVPEDHTKPSSHVLIFWKSPEVIKA